MAKKISIIEAPLHVGAGLLGTELLPKALLDAGLAAAVSGTVVQGPGNMTWNANTDATSAAPDFAAVRQYCLRLAGAVERD